jgi:hypothetical protein
MIIQRKLQVAAKTEVGRKVDSDPSALVASLGTALGVLAFGLVWFVFLRGLTALGRMLTVWPFYI